MGFLIIAMKKYTMEVSSCCHAKITLSNKENEPSRHNCGEVCGTCIYDIQSLNKVFIVFRKTRQVIVYIIESITS